MKISNKAIFVFFSLVLGTVTSSGITTNSTWPPSCEGDVTDSDSCITECGDDFSGSTGGPIRYTSDDEITGFEYFACICNQTAISFIPGEWIIDSDGPVCRYNEVTINPLPEDSEEDCSDVGISADQTYPPGEDPEYEGPCAERCNKVIFEDSYLELGAPIGYGSSVDPDTGKSTTCECVWGKKFILACTSSASGVFVSVGALAAVLLPLWLTWLTVN
jgi:hypothetical protein